jgi:hypothetical protein
MTLDRPTITDDDVLTFVLAGCNANEVAAYAGVSVQTASAMLSHARTLHAMALNERSNAAGQVAAP